MYISDDIIYLCVYKSNTYLYNSMNGNIYIYITHTYTCIHASLCLPWARIVFSPGGASTSCCSRRQSSRSWSPRRIHADWQLRPSPRSSAAMGRSHTAGRSRDDAHSGTSKYEIVAMVHGLRAQLRPCACGRQRLLNNLGHAHVEGREVWRPGLGDDFSSVCFQKSLRPWPRGVRFLKRWFVC